MSPRLPSFLVIGAMKSGTTTLNTDLESQPSICMTQVKEPSVLVRMEDPDEARAYYQRLFAAAKSDQLLGENSTHYSQLPRYAGVAERARRVIGPDVRVVYIVRDPVERAISHHFHMVARGHTTAGIDELVRRDATLVQFGRYAMQLQPWIDTFGLPQVLVVRFEDYVAARVATMTDLGRFLGASIDPARLPSGAANQGEDARDPGRLRGLIRSDLYTFWLRRIVPAGVRARLRRVVLRSRARERERPSAATIDFLVENLRDDGLALARVLGRPAPLWDLDATRARLLGRGDAG